MSSMTSSCGANNVSCDIMTSSRNVNGHVTYVTSSHDVMTYVINGITYMTSYDDIIT